ncbi:hypothetical protein ASZ90_005614 [hydrocarbon metagenome]|uniref:Putative tail fiber protein gp53-like C-terminal domain-containing protein n=1 Tax=hydrocarbon metagenome TaxID=938273 RepID=A0A0W8FUI9_9ZZZZ
MAKTIFANDTIVNPAFLNAVNKQRHTGADVDGDGILDYAVATGSNNAYGLTLPTAITAHIAGMPIKFKANHTNTGAATINISSLGAKAIKKLGSLDLEANDIISGQIVTITYDGTYYQLETGSKNKYAVGSGSGNAIILTLSPALTAHVAGMDISFKANHTNTGAVTIDINSLGAVALKKLGSLALEANDIISGQIVTIAYDGTYYQVKSISSSERYAVSTGSDNAYLLTLSPALMAHVNGREISFKANFTNSDAATININSLGAKSIKKYGSVALDANDIVSGQIVTIAYDGTYYQLLNFESEKRYASSTGSSNAYVLTLSPALTAHVNGREISFKANFTNTGAATININSLGAVSLKKNGSSALEANDILSGQIITIAYDGTNYQVKNSNISYTNSLAANGYQKFPGGLILQWGDVSATMADNNTLEVSFPIEFPTACLMASATAKGANDEDNLWAQISTKSKTSVTVRTQNAGEGFDIPGFFWFAIGY